MLDVCVSHAGTRTWTGLAMPWNYIRLSGNVTGRIVHFPVCGKFCEFCGKFCEFCGKIRYPHGIMRRRRLLYDLVGNIGINIRLTPTLFVLTSYVIQRYGRTCRAAALARARPLLAQRLKHTWPLPAALSLTCTALTVRVSDISVSDRQPVPWASVCH